MWILIPLGNPGTEYVATRHNLGRLMLQRWVDDHGPRPGAVHRLPSGTVHALGDAHLALVPGTWMNHSGQAVAEAVQAGFDPGSMLLLCDDKDLPLGMGRLRLGGGDGGHNGLRSVQEHVPGRDLARLRLGIGPFARPLADFVLGEWTEAEWDLIEALDKPFAKVMALLGEGPDLAALQGRVNDASFWNAP
jgi:PTH1 family peptidyl-tRNA hydrolase